MSGAPRKSPHFLLALCTALTAATVAEAGWKRYLVSPGRLPAIALDAAGDPHISFLDDSHPNNYRLRHGSLTGNSGKVETVDQGDAGWDTSIAVDSVGHLHVSYHKTDNRTQTSGLHYAFFDGSSWTVTMVDSGAGLATSIAVDANDLPHISYVGGVNGDELRYAHFDGSNWIVEVARPGPLSAIYFGGTSLALTSTGAAHITFSDWNLPRGLHHATNANGPWEVDDIGEGLDSSLAIDSTGNLHVVFAVETTPALDYAVSDGNTWTLSTIVAGAADHPGLALDPDDRPHVSFYEDFARNGHHVEFLEYARLDSGKWLIQPVLGNAAAERSGIALDSLGLPHIVGEAPTGSESNGVVYAVLTLAELGPAWGDVQRITDTSGETLRAELQVANTGNARSKRASFQCFLSDDATLGLGDTFIGKRRNLPLIGAGRTGRVRMNLTSPTPVAGKFLIAVVVSANPADEIDLNNNVAAAMIP